MIIEHSVFLMKCPYCDSSVPSGSEVLKLRNDNNMFLVPELAGKDREWHDCPSCGVYFSMPRLSPTQIEKMYEIYRSVDFRKETENEYFDRITSLPKAESENNYRIKFIKKYLAGEPSSCFDIGCGGGVLMHSLSQEFKSSSFYGVEPTQNFCELTKKRTRALVSHGYFSKYSFPGKTFDFISCCQVLEHVSDLNQFALDLRTYMHSSSMFFLEVPSLVDFAHLNPSHPRFTEPSHLWYLSEAFLNTLFKSHGFQTIASQTAKTVRERFNLSMLFKLEKR